MGKKEHFFVISDLHLGGKPPSNPQNKEDVGFQMCPEPNRKELAALIRWTAKQQTTNETVHLIIAGDIVDFLAEPLPARISETQGTRKRIHWAIGWSHELSAATQQRSRF